MEIRVNSDWVLRWGHRMRWRTISPLSLLSLLSDYLRSQWTHPLIDKRGISYWTHYSYWLMAYCRRRCLQISDSIANHDNPLISLQMFEICDHLCLSVLLWSRFRFVKSGVTSFWVKLLRFWFCLKVIGSNTNRRNKIWFDSQKYFWQEYEVLWPPALWLCKNLRKPDIHRYPGRAIDWPVLWL